MSNLIFDLVKEHAGDKILSALGGAIGEDLDISDSLGPVLGTVLAGVLDKGSSESGASRILNMVQNSKLADGKFLENISDLLGCDDSIGELENAGEGLLEGIFGAEKLGAISSLLGGVSSLGDGNISKLLKLAAPIMMGSVFRKFTASGAQATPAALVAF